MGFFLDLPWSNDFFFKASETVEYSTEQDFFLIIQKENTIWWEYLWHDREEFSMAWLTGVSD